MRTRTLVVASLLTSMASGALAEPSEDASARLVGAWKQEGEAARWVAFEPERVRLLEDGRRTHFHALYREGQVSLWSWTKNRVWKVAVADDVLTIEVAGSPAKYRRVAAEPDSLRVQPMPLPKPPAVPSERVTKIQSELERRRAEDQAVRTDASRAGEMERVDADNTGYLRALVAEVGWIDARRFGPEAADAAFLVVQHSGDTSLMAAALPEIEKDVRDKVLDAQNFALLHDRLALDLGRKQRYGTQLASDFWGRLVVLPLEDRANVETIRKEFGLFPLSEYLEGFASRTGKKPVFLEWK